MNYFLTEKQRKASHSSCYFEFQKGHYHGKCWLPDSISINDDLWEEFRLSDLVSRVIKEFDYYGITVVTKAQWNEIVELSQNKESVRNPVITEAIPWVNDCFEKYDVFTILGI